MAKYRIALMPGDGIGNDVMDAAKIVLDKIDLDAEYVHADIGWELWRTEGEPLPERTLDTLCQHIPDAFSLGDHLHHFHHGFCVAELQLYATGILIRQNSILVAVHGKGDGGANTNGVQTIGIARLVAVCYCLEVIHSTE